MPRAGTYKRRPGKHGGPRPGRNPQRAAWSWRQLVRQHGTERAIELLQYQPGMGRYHHYVLADEGAHAFGQEPVSAGYEEVHDELPACEFAPGRSLCPADVFDLDLDKLGNQVFWYGGRLSIRVQSHGFGIDVGEPLGSVWTGEKNSDKSEADWRLHGLRGAAAKRAAWEKEHDTA